MKSNFFLTLPLILFCYAAPAKDKIINIASPDKNVSIVVTVDKTISYQVSFKDKVITAANTLSITLADGIILGSNSPFQKSSQQSVNKTVKPLFGMASAYADLYNELLLTFKNNFSIVFRVYNNGVAYRFNTSFPGKIKVQDEEVVYAFTEDVKSSVMPAKNFVHSYEENYIDGPISYLDSGKMAALPLLTESKGVKVAITEADLLDYGALYFTYDNDNRLKGVLPKFVLKDSIGGCCPNFNKIPFERADYIAETDGTRSFPWRLMIIAEKDKDLLYNNLVYLLAAENKIGDATWIKPGKVAWDWWSANNLTGVPFKTGFNTDTYKYFIDFAAANGIEYINLDEGWSSQFDLLKLNDGSIKIGTNAGGGLDMPFLFDYAKKKNVGIILWCVWHTLERQMTVALDQFEKWGVKGLKVDFMDRDDQAIVNFYERLAQETAKRKMLVNFHGAFKPTGLERTYPNVINREAVQGLEYDKFSNKCTPEHAAHIPFIRMLAGPMDYTPGGLNNVNEKDFRIVMERPVTQGTRCQQLAMFTIFYAPLEMLSDAPTAYQKEPDILHYLAAMPTTWDETIPLDGKVGDYAVIARRKGNDWFIAGLNDWTGRKLIVNFDFLNAGEYQAEIFADGPNANRVGNDYLKTNRKISKGENVEIEMLNGGGFAMKLSPVK
ncbi:MAG: glycoside hydrolase family 97 protein [Ferruginibacter sp.]